MKTVIFDFDGTLVDSFKVAIEVAHELTHRAILVQPEEIVRLRQLRLLDVARELKLPRWQWPFLLIRGRRMMTRRLNEVLPFADMPAVVKDLHESGYKLLVMSSNSQVNVQKVLDARSLSQYFSFIKGGIGLMGKSKGLRELMLQKNLVLADCIYVGDEPRDVEGSRKVGMPCISVTWGFNAPELLKDHHPLAVVDTPQQLREELKKWGGK
ncbi:MAG: HAD-IA family hydrolase [Patescibacteria group bacterium]|nr:HAD-IA family hydrolase [Patescibacteria group bacterium]